VKSLGVMPAGDGSFWCPHGCTREFRSEMVFNVHMAEVHGEGPGAVVPPWPDETPEPTELTCPECGDTFKSDFGVEMHRQKVHGQKENRVTDRVTDPIMCGCGAGPFRNIQQRGAHRRNAHPKEAQPMPPRTDPAEPAPKKNGGVVARFYCPVTIDFLAAFDAEQGGYVRVGEDGSLEVVTSPSGAPLP
jgi:hypothetical protein